MRTQLTLFVEENKSEAIERIREKFNPEQYALIKSHVTICREHELEQIEKIISGLIKLRHSPITINFGKVIRFSNGAGVLLPAAGDNKEYHSLRQIILQPVIQNIQEASPHITLMHPGNSFCTNNLYQELENIRFPVRLQFRKISLIEQEAGKKWQIVREFELTNTGK
ncbi:MAG: 2'-5' RNA ligase family protein [Ferruginibacter sp.]